MFSQTYSIGNYMPVMKAEQSGKQQDQMAIVDGRNFAWNGTNVFSAYNGEAAANSPVFTMKHPGMFTIADRPHVFDEGDVTRRNPDGTWTVVYTYENAEQTGDGLDEYQWTDAYVGTKHMFCHPRVGIVWYDQFDDEWGMLREDCWSGPTYAICLADNRLIVLLQDVVTWSWFDLGMKFDQLWQSGSGCQSLALIKYGVPFTVVPYGGGFLTFTSMGVMISRPEGTQTMHPEGDRLMLGALVFQHSLLTNDEVAIGPTAVTHAGEGLAVWLCQRGFRAFQPSQGGGFGSIATWQAEMGAFYEETVLREIYSAPPDYVMMQFCRELNTIFVSVRDMTANYNRAHAFQIDYEKWGSFDYTHKTFGPGLRGGPTILNKQLGAYISGGFVEDIAHSPGGDSWIKFSPLRLQLPQEQTLPASTIISVQELRLGTTRGEARQLSNLPFGLVSAWTLEKFRAHMPTKCDVLLSGGWDENTQNYSEGEYATLMEANVDTARYVVDVTGLTHSLYLVCDADDHYFAISHVEASFFFAGQL